MLKEEKVANINSVLEYTLNYITENKNKIVDIIALVEDEDGVINLYNSTKDNDFLYLAYRKIRDELDRTSSNIYEEIDSMSEIN